MIEHSIRITSHCSIPLAEIRFRTSRSSGPGGQNVNKLETKVELLFDVAASPSLTAIQRDIILQRLSRKIDPSGCLSIVEQRSRSQYQNKELAVARFAVLLRDALTPVKRRQKTKPSNASRLKRLEAKRRIGEKKRFRRTSQE